MFSSPYQALLGSAVDVMLLMSVDSRKLVLARGTAEHTRGTIILSFW